jgi:NAD(P)-dependent dehydrogenase (short-subunit alcohol dehydrogenase family)
MDGLNTLIAFMADKPVLYLFNNAGYLDNSSLATLNPNEFDTVMNTNVKAPMFLVQKIKFAPNARIVNVGSGAAFEYYPPMLVYGMSKLALQYMTKVFNAELNA